MPNMAAFEDYTWIFRNSEILFPALACTHRISLCLRETCVFLFAARFALIRIESKGIFRATSISRLTKGANPFSGNKSWIFALIVNAHLCCVSVVGSATASTGPGVWWRGFDKNHYRRGSDRSHFQCRHGHGGWHRRLNHFGGNFRLRSVAFAVNASCAGHVIIYWAFTLPLSFRTLKSHLCWWIIEVFSPYLLYLRTTLLRFAYLASGGFFIIIAGATLTCPLGHLIITICIY